MTKVSHLNSRAIAKIVIVFIHHANDIAIFWNRIGSYVHDWLADYTNSCNRGEISAEKTANLFERCYAAKHNKYVSFDDRTIYIEELEAEG